MSQGEVSSSGSNPRGTPGSGPVRSRRPRRHWIAVAGIAGVAIVVIVAWRIAVDLVGPPRAVPEAVPVVLTQVTRGDFVEYRTLPGTVTPTSSVVVRSPVAGRLNRVAFRDGETVAKGALLATVDPHPYAAELSRATGKLAGDQAALANAQATLERYRTLLAQHSIAPQRVSDQAAHVAQLQAVVDADQGQTDIRLVAPISGMASLREADVGNQVGPSDLRGIVRITQLAPTAVVFALPAGELPPLLARVRAHDSVPVVAYGSTGRDALGDGRVLGIDNTVDPATGTVKLKAAFANPQGTLFPGQAVTVRVPVATLKNATLVPSAAIQHGADGSFVYALAKGDTVTLVPVTVGPDDGTTAVILDGVAAGTRVVVEGADRLQPGSRVVSQAASTRDVPPASSTAAAA